MLEGSYEELVFRSHAPNYIRDITSEINRTIATTQTESGLVVVSSPHTTMGFYLNETAEYGLLNDMRFRSLKMIPEDRTGVWGQDPNYTFEVTDEYEHDCMASPLREGEIDIDRNGGRHVRTIVFTETDIVRPYLNGEVLLGKYQGIAIWEQDGRDGSGQNPERVRTVYVSVYPFVMCFLGRREIQL